MHSSSIDTISFDSIKFSVRLKESPLKFSQDSGSLILEFENKTNSEIFISNPNCRINLEIKVFEENKELPILLKIKPSADCAKKYFSLKPDDHFSTQYDYKVKDLFSIKEGHSYIIRAYYWGVIKINDFKIIKHNDKAMISTFYFQTI